MFCVDFHPRSHLVASGSFDQAVKLWDVRSGECVKSLAAHSDPVTSLSFNRDGTLLSSCSFDGMRYGRLCMLAPWQRAVGLCTGGRAGGKNL